MTEPGLQDVLYGPAGQLEAVPTLITLPPAPLIAAFFLGLALLLMRLQQRAQGAMRTVVRVGRWAAWSLFGAAMLFWGSFVFDQWSGHHLTLSFHHTLHYAVFGTELRIYHSSRECNSGALESPVITREHLCRYKSVRLCDGWQWDRRCLVVRIDNDMYAQPWFRDVLADVIHNPCSHVWRKDLIGRSEFWCDYKYIRPRFTVRVAVEDLGGRQASWPK